MKLPKMCRIRQSFERPRVDDVEAETRRRLASQNLAEKIQPGDSVAITVGSRGIANIARITRVVVDAIREVGGVPFIVPSMGSHGGATVAGQLAVLASMGVTEESLGTEIRATMETVVVAQTPQGVPVHFDRHAAEARHVIVMGRVKPHTGFVGPIESGLHKMMLIGLGKHQGALTYHRAIKDHSFETIIRAVAEIVLVRCRVLLGLAIVENAFDETALIEAVAPADFFVREQALLRQAIDWMPRLPFPEADLLIVDRIGKEISGTGMDTNIIGRKYNDHVAMPADQANCRRILVRSLTEKTQGNATGIGIAEFTTQRVLDQIDFEKTRINCITSGHPTGAMIPVVYSDDRAAIQDALVTIGLTEPEDARVQQISDTLHLEEVLISEAYLRGGEDWPFEILSPPEEMRFSEQGELEAVPRH